MRASLVKSIFLHGALFLFLVLPLAAPAASKGDVQNYLLSVRHLFESMEYDHALTQIQLARQLPRGTEEEVTLSLFEGVILCEMSKQGQGAASFKSALLLQPDAKLPVKVGPKVEKLFHDVRQEAKRELASLLPRREAPSAKAPSAAPPSQPAPSVAPPPTTVASSTPRREALRRHALIPAIAGGTLAVAGGLSWTLSRSELSQLRNNDPRLATLDDAQRAMSRGRTLQTVGVSLLGAGAAGLATAAGMYLLGAPSKPMTLGVSTNGTSAFVHGEWP